MQEQQGLLICRTQRYAFYSNVIQIFVGTIQKQTL
jgi:hypothetical protein